MADDALMKLVMGLDLGDFAGLLLVFAIIALRAWNSKELVQLRGENAELSARLRVSEKRVLSLESENETKPMETDSDREEKSPDS